MNQNPLNAYKSAKVMTAGQGKLIVMLYDEAVRQLGTAIEEMERPDKGLEKIHNSIVKAQTIITELMASLDFEKGGEIAQNLYGLYAFFNQQLLSINMEKNPGPLKEIKGLMTELRDAWSTIEGQSTAGSADGGVNIAG